MTTISSDGPMPSLASYSTGSSKVQLITAVSLYLKRRRREKDDATLDGKNKKRAFSHRAKRRVFDHRAAYNSLQRDHLGPDPLFGKEFLLFFRLGRSRVQLILEKLGNSGDKYWTSFRVDRYKKTGPSLEAKVLLPIRVLAYGVAAHCFCDYFQMSTTTARECVTRFNQSIPLLFGDEYLRLPDAQDLRSITSLHKRVHGVEGMLGSLDCMHTYWKNCPVAWQQSFCGKSKGPTIVLEAIADHYLWFWHLSYGYSGALNDLNILNLSPFLKGMTDGSFSSVEEESGVVPFTIGKDVFDKLYVLVDGIYPKYCRFVRGFKGPITPQESKFTGWQEAARKDIERAFGVLQCKFKVLSYPIHTIDMGGLSCLVTTCLVLHNMAVSDRVMGDPSLRYCPRVDSDYNVLAEDDAVDDMYGGGRGDCKDGGGNNNQRTKVSTTTLAAMDEQLAKTVATRTEWAALKDDAEWSRLQYSLIDFKGKTNIDGSE